MAEGSTSGYERRRRGPFRRPLVGRDRELEILRDVWSQALQGEGAAAFVSGEPGIGKTRLVNETAQAATKAGMRVVWGHCYPDEGTLPYRPWGEALKSIAAADGSPQTASVVEDLRKVAPEAYPRESPGARTPGDQLRLLDSMMEFLLGAAASRPTLLVLEDLHWADNATVVLLRHVGRRLRLGALSIIGTYRDIEVDASHALLPVVVELRERGLAEAISLRGLSLDETRVLVAYAAADEVERVPAEFAALVYGQTEGNPFFVEEVVEDFVESGQYRPGVGGRFSSPDAGLIIPKRVLPVLERRLDRLRPEDREVLTAAAVLGRTFDRETLKLMSGVKSGAAQVAIRTGEGLGMLQEVRAVPGQYMFSHALIQRALVETVDGNQRRQLHLDAANAIQGRYGANLVGRCEVIAEHLRTAGALADPERLIPLSTEAITYAVYAYGWDEAKAEFEATKAFLERVGAAPLVQARFIAASLLILIRRGRMGSGEAVRLAEPASQTLLEHGEVQAATHLMMTTAWALSLLEDRFANQDLERAIELCGRVLAASDDTRERGTARLLIANARLLQGRFREVLGEIDELLDLPRPEGRFFARILQTFCWSYQGALRDAFREFAQVFREAGAIADNGSQVFASFYTIMLAQQLRAPRESGDLMVRLMEQRQGETLLMREASLLLASAQRAQGLAVQQGLETEGVGDWALVFHNVRLFRDEPWVVAIAGLERLLSDIEPSALENRAIVAGFLAEALRFAGRFEEAEPLLERHFNLEPIVGQLVRETELGLLFAETGRWDQILERVACGRRLMTTGEDWGGLGARVDLLEAVAAVVNGNGEQGGRLFGKAVAATRQVGSPWEESEAHYQYGRALITTRATAAAATHFDASLKILLRIGAGEEFIERVLSAKRAAGGSELAPGAGVLAMLSAREHEVLAMISEGCSNRQIADRLVVSEATVATHVRHILEKTGAANRTEAAALAFRHGLANSSGLT